MALTNGSPDRPRLSSEDVARARDLRRSGLTFAEVASTLSDGGRGVTTQQIWQAVAHNGGDPLRDDGRGASAARFAARWAEDVRSTFSETRDPAETARRLGLAERPVRRFLAEQGLLHLALPAGSDQLRQRRWEPAGMEAVLQQAAAENGEPLSLSKYERWVVERERVAPSQRTITVRYGSWRAACEAAGVKPGDSSRSYQPAVTAEECMAAVAQYVNECARAGTRATLTGYEQISALRGWPCRNTVVVRCAGSEEHHRPWRSIVREVLASNGATPASNGATPANSGRRSPKKGPSALRAS